MATRNHKSIKHHKLPLSSNYFPSIKLTETEVEKCNEFASNLLDSYLKSEYEERMGKSTKYWYFLGDKNGINSYMRNGVAHCSWHFKFQAKVRGTVRDILDGLYCDNTEEFRDMCEHVHEDKLVDCSVLGVIKYREESNDDCFKFLGFKWKGFAPVSSNVEGRDYCLLEYSGITKDAAGDELGFRIFESIQVPECPSQYETLGFVRGKMSRCCLYRDGPERGMVQVLVLGYYDPCAACEEWKIYRNNLIRQSMHNLAACVVNIPTCIEAKSISSRLFLPESQWVEDRLRKMCFLCQKNFNLLRHRHHCRVCGEIMCGNCSIRKTFRQYNNGSPKVEYVRICKRCKGNAQTIPKKKSNSFTASSGSDSVDYAIVGTDNNNEEIQLLLDDALKLRSYNSKSSMSNSDEVFKDGLFTLRHETENENHTRTSSVCSENNSNQDTNDTIDTDYVNLICNGSKSNIAMKQLSNTVRGDMILLPRSPARVSSTSLEEETISTPEIPPAFQKINKTLAEQEMLIDAMKNAAASQINRTSARITSPSELKEDPNRFELLQ